MEKSKTARVRAVVTCAVISTLFFRSATVMAQCCSGGVPMSGNIGMPSADQHTLQLALSYDYNKLSRFQTGRDVLTSEEFNRETHSILLEAGYTISKRFSVDLFMSWIDQSMSVLLAGNTLSTRGIGDATLLLKYKILSSLNVGYGIKAPLGASDFTAVQDGVETPLFLDLQPGSGAWDQIFWTGYSVPFKAIRPSTTFSTTATFRWTGNNDDFFFTTYEVGNEFWLNTSLSDRFLIGTLVFDPSIGINFRKRGTDTSFQFDNPNSGGTFVFVNPGIAYQVTPDLSWQVNAAIPIYRDVGGTQVAPTYRINTGFFYRLKLKKDAEYEL